MKHLSNCLIRPKAILSVITLFALVSLFVLVSMTPAIAYSEEYIPVDSVDALRELLDRDGIKVKMAAGDYKLMESVSPSFFEFSGSDAVFDFTGVKIIVPSLLLSKAPDQRDIVRITGDRITLKGLEIRTTGDHVPEGGGGRIVIHVVGDDVSLLDLTLFVQGSYPYGYGGIFGIGSEQVGAIVLKKLSGIRLGPVDRPVLDNCRVIMRSFGHGIVIQGAHDTVIKNCYVEGTLRSTDEMLAEGPGELAYELGFNMRAVKHEYTRDWNRDGAEIIGASLTRPIPPGHMESLSEDGIRAYSTGNAGDMSGDRATARHGRSTVNVRVENCTVKRMRRGVDLALASGEHVVENCRVIENSHVGMQIGSNTTVTGSYGDARYSPILDLPAENRSGSVVELTVLDSREPFGNEILARINGSRHTVTLIEAEPGYVPVDLTVEVGTWWGWGGRPISRPRGNEIRLKNRTPAPVILHEAAKDCLVESLSHVTNRNKPNGNRIVSIQQGSMKNTPERSKEAASALLYRKGELLFEDSFQGGLENWSPELQAGGRVEAVDGKLVVDVPSGCTIWFRHELEGPLMISYEVTVIGQGGPNDRVSDLNCFWMARDARSPDDIFGHARSGMFSDYHELNCYYVGLGGHHNTRTRFRRYIGDAVDRPLLPDHDLAEGRFMIEPNQTQVIRLVAFGNLIQYYRDDELIFSVTDAAPYTKGWFAFRTVHNHMEIENFQIHRLDPAD